jgi:glycosyltransferase involved in cell wall biosynthesis
LYEKYSYFTKDIVYVARTEQDPDCATSAMPLPKEMEVIPVPNFLNPRVYFKNKKEAKRIMKKAVLEADLVILKLSTMSMPALKYAKKYNKPYIVECVGCCWDALRNHSIRGKLFAPIAFLQSRMAIQQAGYVSYVTNEFLQKRYPTHGISCGLSDVVLKDMEEEVLRKRISKIEHRDSHLVLGTAGAVDTVYKGQEYVIRAIAGLKKKGYAHLTYSLVGGGSCDRLKKLAKDLGVDDLVEFKGSIPHEQVFDWLDSIDLYIQPSTTEGLPRAVVEAMSRACPILGSDVGGIPELINSKALFPVKDVRRIEELILSMDKEKMEGMARENFKTAHNYEKKELDRKRKEFYDLFLDSIRKEPIDE